LDASEFLILLASPQAAESVWVKRELAHWLRTKPHEKIMIALTGGALVWDHHAGDFDWTRTTALPADVLRGVFRAEPSYVDLRAAKAQPRSRIFKSLVADLAAPLHHRPKDEMVGEDHRVYRRNRATATAGVLALVALTLASALFAVLAEQRARAAEQTARVATSRQLAAQSEALPDTADPALAGLLAAAGWRLDENEQTQHAMLTALQRPGLHRLEGDLESLSSVVFSPDGRRLATASYDDRPELADAPFPSISSTSPSANELVDRRSSRNGRRTSPTGHTNPSVSTLWRPERTTPLTTGDTGCSSRRAACRRDPPHCRPGYGSFADPCSCIRHRRRPGPCRTVCRTRRTLGRGCCCPEWVRVRAARRMTTSVNR
jgi:type II secretory pathway pseudopilin PulG